MPKPKIFRSRFLIFIDRIHGFNSLKKLTIHIERNLESVYMGDISIDMEKRTATGNESNVVNRPSINTSDSEMSA